LSADLRDRPCVEARERFIVFFLTCIINVALVDVFVDLLAKLGG
jgi:hypothetical protein